METEEITKLVDGIYKNILDKFNPGARQMINAGKAYLKALHGAAAASRMYVDAITKLARQSQQGTWGGSSDIGSALMQIVEVYKEIQAQQMNILKAFYVDLLVPLETNLEKDTKVVQSEQKKFLQQHKQRSETYSKAAATIKKQRKKQRNTAKTGIAMDKELKSMQILEEERSKLDAFCEQSLKNAMTQERRRYGFVLERQCSLAKHYLAYHSAGHALYQNHLDEWQEVAKTREFLPNSVENMFANKLTTVSFWGNEGGSPKTGDEDDRASIGGASSQLRKTKSMDASCLDVRNLNEMTHSSLTRAKSDFNLTASTQSLSQELTEASPGRRPKSLAVCADANWDTPLARAMYAYLSSGENQLSFLEGDVIALMGERNKGWQFGENLRTQCSGWFPLAYTEPFIDDSATSASSPTHKRAESASGLSPGNRATTVTRFGDTLALRNACQIGTGVECTGGVSGFNVGPPQTPAPVAPRRMAPRPRPPPPPHNPSLHSSNDSGFSNDPPPAPEVDYSDDDTARNTIEKNNRKNKSQYGGRKTKGWLSDSVDDFGWTSGGEKTLSRRQASSAGQLATLGRGEARIQEVQARLRAVEIPYDKKAVKRTRSLWKFRRGGANEGPLEGMAMWKHRSLIDISPNGSRGGGERTPRPGKKPLSLPVNKPPPPPTSETSSETEGGTDSESCIVIDDHRKRPDNILPRTRLLAHKKHDPQPPWFNTWDSVKN